MSCTKFSVNWQLFNFVFSQKVIIIMGYVRMIGTFNAIITTFRPPKLMVMVSPSKKILANTFNHCAPACVRKFSFISKRNGTMCESQVAIINFENDVNIELPATLCAHTYSHKYMKYVYASTFNNYIHTHKITNIPCDTLYVCVLLSCS